MKSTLQSTAPGKAGISLVEVLVSLTVLALALVSLAPLMLTVSRRSASNTTTAHRNEVLGNRVRLLGTVAFDSLSPGTHCQSVTAQPFPNTTCWTVSSLSTTLRRVRVVTTPSVVPTVAPDSVVFDRVQLGFNPFNANPATLGGGGGGYHDDDDDDDHDGVGGDHDDDDDHDGVGGGHDDDDDHDGDDDHDEHEDDDDD